jgi:hypothetical protein
VQGNQQVRVTGGTSASRNKLAQTITLCPGTSTLTLTAWAVDNFAAGCSLRLCIGNTCSSSSLTTSYVAYEVEGKVSGSPGISAEIYCPSSPSSIKAYLDFVTVG